MSIGPLNGFGAKKSGDAPETVSLDEGAVVCSTSSTHLTNAKHAAGRGGGYPGAPRRVRPLLAMTIGRPVTVDQSRDVQSEPAGERPARQCAAAESESDDEIYDESKSRWHWICVSDACGNASTESLIVCRRWSGWHRSGDDERRVDGTRAKRPVPPSVQHLMCEVLRLERGRQSCRLPGYLRAGGFTPPARFPSNIAVEAARR